MEENVTPTTSIMESSYLRGGKKKQRMGIKKQPGQNIKKFYKKHHFDFLNMHIYMNSLTPNISGISNFNIMLLQ